MTKIETPTYLQDTSLQLSADGFKTSSHWYHGTTSGLVQSIQEYGLKGSGDAELNKKTTSAMTNIGATFTENKEPVFLTQSKELAYYWAAQKTSTRKLRLGTNETPAVLIVSLPEELNQKVRPDVGAATMLLEDNNAYIEYLSALYATHKMPLAELDPAKTDRMAYLNQLGMAYINDDIDSKYLQLLTENT